LLSTSNIFAQYQWFINTVSIAGATNATYAPTTNGNYRVRVTDANGCTSFSSGYPVNTVGINDINSAAVSLYPNPVSETLQIAYATPVRVVVSTVDGRIVADERNVNSVNMAGNAAGVYMVTVYSASGDRLLVQKVVKQ
jgi:membrane carboxypeptidase/penicillin-binding protein PbpC